MSPKPEKWILSMWLFGDTQRRKPEEAIHCQPFSANESKETSAKFQNTHGWRSTTHATASPLTAAVVASWRSQGHTFPDLRSQAPEQLGPQTELKVTPAVLNASFA
ncbi:uncharacterized protein RHO17_024809 [Thomomys bottae]